MTRGSSRTSKLVENRSARTPGDTERDGLRYDLLAYDTSGQRVSDELVEFLDGDEAQTAFTEAEERLRCESELQVVMFVARSLDNLRSTHPPTSTTRLSPAATPSSS